MSNYTLFSSSLPEIETLGLLEAIKLVVARGFPSVIFESDCKFVVDAVNSSQVPHNEIGDIISRSQDLLSSHSQFSISFVRR